MTDLEKYKILLNETNVHFTEVIDENQVRIVIPTYKPYSPHTSSSVNEGYGGFEATLIFNEGKLEKFGIWE